MWVHGEGPEGGTGALTNEIERTEFRTLGHSPSKGLEAERDLLQKINIIKSMLLIRFL